MRKGWEVRYTGFCVWKEANDDDDYDSDDNVNYYDNSEYDRRHVMFNSIVPNKSQKYQQGRKIDDHDYDEDDEAAEAKANAEQRLAKLAKKQQQRKQQQALAVEAERLEKNQSELAKK